MDSRSSNHEETQIPWAYARRVRHLVDNPPSPLPIDLPVEIAPWLFLSDEINARRASLLHVMGITHVLTVNSMPSRDVDEMRGDLKSVGIAHKHVKAEDEEGYDLIVQHWLECREYLQSVRDSGGKALVRCVAGINRSGLVVCAARVALDRTTLLEAVEDCVKKGAQCCGIDRSSCNFAF